MTARARSSARADRSRVDERAFHRWLKRTLPAGRSGSLPLGDDAASIVAPSGRVAVLSTDALIENVHFFADSPPLRIGRAATSVSLSDAAAKGATPVGILLDLLVPPRTPVAWMRSVVQGAERAAARFGAHVIGGDTKPSATRTVVSTVVAWGDPAHLAPRSGARAGDLAVVTGRVGRGGRAWEGLLRASTPRTKARARAALLEVTPRVREGAYLARFAHAMLDTSDGLADAAHLLSEASGIQIELDEPAIPWVAGLVDRSTSGFFGGDYELLAAIAPTDWERARRTPGVGVTRVGRFRRGVGAFLVSPAGRRPLARAGWQPFLTAKVEAQRRRGVNV